MSIRNIVKKIFPEKAWPYLQIPYRMCWALRRKTVRAFTNRSIIAKAEKYLPYYEDDLSARIFRDREEYIRTQDDNIFVKRAHAEGWSFSEIYGIPREKYSRLTVIYSREGREFEHTKAALELLASPPEYRFVKLKDFLSGASIYPDELIVFLVNDWEFIRAEKYISAKGITNDTIRDIFAVREECQYVDVFDPVKNEVIVDAGAYIGDTALRFMKWGGDRIKHIYSFELDPSNSEKYHENLKDFSDKVTLIQAGTWDNNEILNISSAGSGSHVAEDGGIEVRLTTIDETVKDERVTFIKMDVEGAELKSLIGASRTITKNHPRLAICIYHKKEDLYTLPEYILSLVPEYRFRLRHYSSNSFETVLYAEVPGR